MTWKTKLLDYGEVAFQTGQELIFQVKRRQDKTEYRIFLRKLVNSGVENSEFIDD